MKRERELQLAIVEIVEEGKAKDTNGEPLYPVMYEPFVMALFGAPEALFDALKERPIVILNLLQTNKALNSFWNRFNEIWVLMIDYLVEKEWPTPLSADIYPFFAVTNHRIHETTKRLFRNVDEHRIAGFMERNRHTGLLKRGTRTGRFDLDFNETYSITYYDPVTKLVIEILQRILGLADFFHQPIATRPYLNEYLDKIKVYSFTYFVCLGDGFLMGKDDTRSPRYDLEYTQRLAEKLTEEYDIYVHGPLASNEVEIAIEPREIWRERELVGVFPLRVAESLAEVKRLLSRLGGMLRRHFEGSAPITDPIPKPMPLDANTARPFRDLLYHKEQGLYNTPEKQKTLFIALLKEIAVNYDYEEVIEKYGEEMPLTCAFCHTQTQLVDPLLMRVFCTQTCRTLYDQ